MTPQSVKPSTSKVVIRPASTPYDWVAVRELFVRYFESLDAQICKPDLEREINALPGVFGDTGGCVLIAWQEEGEGHPVAVGCSGVRPGPEEGVAEMCRLYVDDTQRGRGLGLTLAEAAVTTATELGYRRMVLHTLAHWAPAMALYRTLGFRPGAPYGDVHGP
ncbi:MAG: GNAT family N-acetyltransferase, partial [Alphaproteobacteria bacterium]|nr:GNAT family N-acetyltransferase [Alphaproteobacteria bacterium]